MLAAQVKFRALSSGTNLSNKLHVINVKPAPRTMPPPFDARVPFAPRQRDERAAKPTCDTVRRRPAHPLAARNHALVTAEPKG